MNRLHQPAPTHTDRYRTFSHWPHQTRHQPHTRGTGAPHHTGRGSERTLSPASRNRQFRGGYRGEITRWDKFAAHRSGFLRHTHRMDPRRMDHSRSVRKESRYQVAAPRRRRRDTAVVGHIGDGTTAGSTTRTRKTRTDAPPHTGEVIRRRDSDGRNPRHHQGTGPRRVTGAPRATDAPSRPPPTPAERPPSRRQAGIDQTSTGPRPSRHRHMRLSTSAHGGQSSPPRADRRSAMKVTRAASPLLPLLPSASACSRADWRDSRWSS